MSLQESLLKYLGSVVEPISKKQRMKNCTPLKNFLNPIIEKSMQSRMQMGLQQMPQLGAQSSGMIEPPSVNPLQNALMSMGRGGKAPSPQGGISNGNIQ